MQVKKRGNDLLRDGKRQKRKFEEEDAPTQLAAYCNWAMQSATPGFDAPREAAPSPPAGDFQFSYLLWSVLVVAPSLPDMLCTYLWSAWFASSFQLKKPSFSKGHLTDLKSVVAAKRQRMLPMRMTSMTAPRTTPQLPAMPAAAHHIPIMPAVSQPMKGRRQSQRLQAQETQSCS